MVKTVSCRPVAALALTGLVAACGGPAAPPEITATTTATVQNQKAQPAHDSRIRQLDGDGLAALFSGRDIGGLAPDGQKWQASFDRAGRATISWNGPAGRGSDTGSWEIDGNANCVTWQTLADGEENCMTVYQVDEGQYNLFNDNGSMNSLIMVLGS